MADLRVSELPPLAGTDLAATDLLPVADVSASETRRLTAKELVQNGVVLIDNGSLPGGKLAVDSVTAAQIGPNAITASELADASVDTNALMDLAVTNSKLAAGLDGAKLIGNTVTADKVPAASLDRGIDKTSGKIGHTNAIAASTRSGISYDAQGHVTGAIALTGSDLPIATATAIGGISVPDSSLAVSGTGALTNVNAIAAGTQSGISYDARGHITAVAPLVPSDLPVATATTDGVVKVPGPALSVDGSGNLTHATSTVGPGIYPKVTVDSRGHVTAGQLLAASDIPSLDASRITTGTFNPARIADGTIEKEKLANYSTVIIQEANPGNGNYTGQFWYKESDAQLRTWSGNSWINVGFGRLSEENLRFCGTFDAATGNVLQITPFGVTAALTPGSAIPAATDKLTGVYLVCDKPGTYSGDAYDEGDWVLCLGQVQGWARIDTLSGSGATVKLQDLLDTKITTPASGDTLIFDGGTNKWVNKPTAATKATFVEAIDGTRTNFTLSADANSVTNLLISLGGIIQEQGVDFTFTAPRTVNFAGAPPPGINYWVLIEGVASTGGGGGGATLPPGTAAEEYLQWNATLSSWQPSTTLNGGSF